MDKLVKWLENLLRAQKKSRAWRTFVSCLAAIVVFTTTYSLILPAITVETSATEEVGGLVMEEADPGSTGAEAEASGEVVTVDAENEIPEENTAEAEAEEAAPEEEAPAADEVTAPSEDTSSESSAAPAAAPQTETVKPAESTAAVIEEVKEPVNGEVQTIGDSRIMSLTGDDFDVVVSSDLSAGVSDGTVLSVRGVSDAGVAGSFSSRISDELLKIFVDAKTTEAMYQLVFTDENLVEYTPAGNFDVQLIFHNNSVSHSGEMIYAAIYDYLTDEMILAETNGDGTPIVSVDGNGVITGITLKGLNFGEYSDVITLVAGPVNEELKLAAEKAAESGAEKAESTGSKTDSAKSKSEGPAAKAETSKESKASGSGTLTFRGGDYTVTLAYNAEAKIPTGAALEVKEIENDTAAYKKYLEQAKAAMGLDKDQVLPKEQARFFDIKIMADGKEVQPAANVNVNITYDQPVVETDSRVETQIDASAVHFNKKSAEVINVSEADANRVEFEAESFSIYGVIYTVDFVYGGYVFNLGGNHEINLSELLQILNIDVEMADVADVTVELVAQIDETADKNEFYVERKKGDWLLKSDVAFGNIYNLKIEQRDGSVYVVEVRDAGTVDLTTLCGPSDISVTCEESEQHTEVSRNASISFTMNYKIHGPKINDARDADEWVYDMSGMIGTDPDSPLADISEGSGGAIHDDYGNVVGEYSITGGKIILKITENSFWIDPQTGLQKRDVSGFVSFNAQLNENHNYNKTDETIHFPGNADVPLIYETKTLQSSKGVGTTEGQYSPTADSSEVQMVENADGTYTLYYEISATPNINFKTLSVSDTLEGGQTLDPFSVQLSVGGGSWENIQVNTTGNGFTFDIAANQGGTAEGAKQYKIRYKTTLTKAQVENGAVQRNRASWNWDVGTNEDNTSVKPKFDKNVSVGKTAGVVEGTYNLGNWADANVVENPDGSATIYYDVKITPNTKDLSSLTVTDEMMGSDSVKVYKGTTSLGSANATGGTLNLLSFLNSQGGIEAGAEYHLHYSTTIQPKEDGTFDPVHNKAHIEYDSTPKDVEITVKPKIDKTVTSTKTVSGNGGEQTSGEIQVQKNNNEDFYRLHYKISVKPGTGSNTLTVKDSISAGQEYISDSFTLGFNDANNQWQSFNISPSLNGNSFNFDLAAFLNSNGYSVTANTTYEIKYDTKIPEDQIGTSQTNTSEWTWDHGTSGPDGTDVTPGIPEKGYKIDKTAKHGDVDVGNNQQHLYVVPGDVVDFTVVVGLDEEGNPKNMAGHRIYDEISNYGTLEGDVTISPAVGETTTLGGSTLDGTADGTTKKVYDFTFPADGDYTQPNGYTITYHIKISENSDLFGRKTLNNKAYIDNTHKETNTPVDYGTPATTKKSFSEWDDNDQKIYWYIDVEIPEGKSLHNLYVTDYHMQYGTQSDGNGWLANAANLSFDSNDITVSWLDDSITEPAPSFTLKNDATTPNDATVNTQGIFFTEITHSIRIRVATVSPVEFDSLSTYYAYNKAYVHSDEGEIGKPGAPTEKYTATEYGFKKTGTYDQETNVATWTVEINKGFLEINPDFEPWFTDKIPDNMELIGDKIYVTMLKGSIYDQQITNQGFSVSVVNNVIQPVYIGEKNQYEKFKLSKNHYVVTYTTKIKDEYLQQIQEADVLTEQKFTNFAELQDEGGNTKKTDDDTVEYKYDNLIDKESGSLILNEYIPYTVTINPEGKVINHNEPYTVSDVISTDVNLYIGRLSGTTYPYVRDASGDDMLESGEASISYNDDTRELAVTVPDGKKVTFVFAVNAIENGTHTFTNSVVLNAEISDEDTTEEEYVIKKSEAGIQGTDLYVSIKKIDRNNPLKGLPGAKFKLVHVSTPGIPRNEDGKPETVTTYVDENGETQYLAGGNGTFGEEEVVGIYQTSGESGGLNFEDIEPYEVYYWVEVDPAPGYIITNTEKHYFVAYPIVRNKPAETTENQHNVWAIDNAATEANGVTIVSARSGYSWNVTNLKQETVTDHFEGVKTLQGRDMAKDEFTFSVEAVSANVTKVVNDEEQQVDLTPEDMPMPEETTVKNPAGTEDAEVGFEFGDIQFTMPGTYIYKIKEEAGGDSALDYDTTQYLANVTVERDSESGKLKDPVITYTKADGTPVDKPAFTNKVKPGSLKVKKTSDYTGADMSSKVYQLAVKNSDGKYVKQDGTLSDTPVWVDFHADDELTWNNLPAGSYTIVENEETAAIPGYKWTVEGEDESVSVAAAQETQHTVTNKYEEKSGKVTIPGDKTLTGRDMTAGEFTFIVKEGDEQVATGTNAAAKNGAEGAITFTEITYGPEDIGEHTYVVTETTPDQDGVTQTGTIDFTVKVKVEDVGTDELKATILDTSDSVSFTNEYTTSTTAKIEGTKKYNADIPDGKFSVKITGDTPLPDSAVTPIGTDGKFAFNDITYPLSVMADVQADPTTGVKTKDFTYTVSEVLPEGVTAENPVSEDGIKYDTTPKTVTVTVKYNESTGVMSAQVSPSNTEFEFENEKLGNLKITKTLKVTNPAGDPEKDFEFTITFDGENAEKLGTSYKAIKTKGQESTDLDVPISTVEGKKTATITLKADEFIEIKNLPLGVRYTVTEKDDPDYVVSSQTGDTGTISKDLSEATFENERILGELEVTKTVQLNGNNTDLLGRSFWVAVYSDSDAQTKVAGPQEITIGTDGTGKATFSNLPVGTYYVYELTAEDGTAITGTSGSIDNVEYTITTDNTGAVITKEETKGTASIVNNKTEKGTLTVEKETLYNEKPDETVSGKKIKIGLYDADQSPVQKDGKNWVQELELSATGTGSVTFSELDYGTYYAYELDDEGNPVKDNSGTINGVKYTVAQETKSVELKHDQQNGEIKIVNKTEEKGSLEVTKEIQVNGEPKALDGTFEFEIALYKVETAGTAEGNTTGEDGEAAATETLVGHKTITVTQGRSSTAKFEGLEVGAVYKVYEVTVDGENVTKVGDQFGQYTVTYENQSVTIPRGTGKDVTGTKVINNIATKEVEVDKKWLNAGGSDITDTIQNAEITVVLKNGETEVRADASGTVINPVTLNGSETPTKWSYRWENLPKYDGNGEEITYSVSETAAKIETDKEGGGTSIIESAVEATADAEGKFHLENTLPKTEIKAVKEWQNENGEPMTGGVYPDGAKVTFEIFAGEAENSVAKVELSGNAGSAPAEDAAAKDSAYESKAWEATFANLPKYDSTGVEITYTIKETVGFTGFENLDPNGVAAGGTIHNKQSSVTLKIVKVDSANNETKLEDAEFTLQEINGDNATIQNIGSPVAKITDENGEASFEKVKFGYYEVAETKTPEGYVLNGDGKFYIKVTAEGYSLLVKESGKAPKEWATAQTQGDVISFTADTANKSVTATVKNAYGAKLPHTGGSGTRMWYFAGLALMAFAACAYVMRRNSLLAEIVKEEGGED